MYKQMQELQAIDTVTEYSSIKHSSHDEASGASFKAVI